MEWRFQAAMSRCCTPGFVDTSTAEPSSPILSVSPRLEYNSSQHMVKIAGDFLMGTNDSDQNHGDGEGPVRKVTVNEFLMDSTAVSNAEFKDFVKKSGYQTEAERFGWSYVFRNFLPESKKQKESVSVAFAPWWVKVEGANWKCPEGPNSDIDQRMEHPVVHVSWYDANNYARWVGKRLPTEREWEFGARGGIVQAKYPWGSQLTPLGKHMCNIWQGEFPRLDTGQDGYIGTAPVRAYQANSYGFYNMSGNVWEWCSDSFQKPDHGPVFGEVDRREGSTETKVTKGGSYLCHQSYCNRYRVSARTSSTPDSTTGHVGFRCAADVIKAEKN